MFVGRYRLPKEHKRMKTDNKKGIVRLNVFSASCSNCGELFEGEGDYIPYFHDKESLKDMIHEYDWSTSLNKDRGNIPKNNIYCPDCFSINENGTHKIRATSNL